MTYLFNDYKNTYEMNNEYVQICSRQIITFKNEEKGEGNICLNIQYSYKYFLSNL